MKCINYKAIFFVLMISITALIALIYGFLSVALAFVLLVFYLEYLEILDYENPDKIKKLYQEANCDNPDLNLWKQGYCHALKDVLEMRE